MSEPEEKTPPIAETARALVAGYRKGGCEHVRGGDVPSRDEILGVLDEVLGLLYPGYFGDEAHPLDELEAHVEKTLTKLAGDVERQVARCLTFDCDRSDGAGAASRIAAAFVARLPEIRRLLVKDAEAAFDGDPAARSLDEIVLAYPGFLAISVHRVAHELHRLGVPLMPRIMSEWAHTQTGADIHPGATIGERFFIDHATGVVIGETTRIGSGVRLYQGVTLGALSLPRDEVGRVVRGAQRHPTVEDDVTIYANATVLGGTTVVGRGSVVGGSVFLTKSVPPGQRVAVEAPRLRVGATAASAPNATKVDVEPEPHER